MLLVVDSPTIRRKNSASDVAWYSDNSGSKTHDVCGKTKNGYGLCDMSGNVYEWVWITEHTLVIWS